jgi:phage baseplate assembly protein W
MNRAGPRGFLGQGWSFPVTVTAGGEITMASDEEDIRQAILMIIETEPGERVMRPDFGCGLRGMLFEPINTATIGLVQQRVQQALVAWEPRIDVKSVRVTAENAAQGRLLIEMDYQVRSTNTFYNLVYPFYLKEGR